MHALKNLKELWVFKVIWHMLEGSYPNSPVLATHLTTS